MDKSIAPTQALAIVAILMVPALLVAADNPWKSKPYQTWNAKDVQAIMTQSPWVQVTSMRRSWHPSPNATVVQPVQQEISGGVRSSPAVVGKVASNTGATEPSQQLNVYVYWYSSRLIRAASAREAVLRGTMDEPVAEKLAAAPQAEYQIVFRMDDMTPFADKGEGFYRQNAFLMMRRSKLKLPPSKVVYEHMGTTSEDVVFFFPKTAAGGTPTITSDETDVVFSCKIADQTVRADFKSKKMVDQFGPDL
ncbi:MAG TPA: hypothetical protein VMF66_08305 [Candidatus Acidoferrum sp.]|nr:hypothetical protein [Candidatus Acidoferrum sp.]